VPTVATTGEGVDDLLGQLDRHDALLNQAASGRAAAAQGARRGDALASARWRGGWPSPTSSPPAWPTAVRPAEAAEELLAAVIFRIKGFSGIYRRVRGVTRD